MMERSKEMATCMGALSQLSQQELINLAEAIEKERKAREDRVCKDKIRTAINALNKLYDYYNHLEIDTEVGMIDIYLTDISEALERLYNLY